MQHSDSVHCLHSAFDSSAGQSSPRKLGTDCIPFAAVKRNELLVAARRSVVDSTASLPEENRLQSMGRLPIGNAYKLTIFDK